MYKYQVNLIGIMRKSKLSPEEFHKLSLEEKLERIQPLLRKLKKWEKEGKFKDLD